MTDYASDLPEGRAGGKPSFERRAFPRFPTQFPANLEAVNGATLPHPAHGCIQNMSCGGFALVTDHSVDNGARMQVSLTFPGDLQPTAFEVEVIELTRWATREFVAHCRFVSLPEDLLRRLDDWVTFNASEESAAP